MSAALVRASAGCVAALLAAACAPQAAQLPPPGAPPEPPPASALVEPPPAAAPAAPAQGEGAFLLTIFLRHDQSKNLEQINAQLEQTELFAHFPPEGIEIVSWYVMMGIGQVVTLRVPPSRLREVNVAIERRAWGAFRTEFYPTYDYRQIYEQRRREAVERRGAAPAGPR